MKKFIRSLGILSFLIGSLFATPPTWAATLTVLSLSDNGTGACELRDAINLINAGGPDAEGCANSGAAYGTSDTILFDGSLTGDIDLTGVLPTLLVSVTIASPPQPITIDGNDNGRVFNINSLGDNITVSISGLTIEDGNFLNGAGINLETGDTLNLNSSVVDSNNATGAGTNNGGGILNNGGILNITNSTISSNDASNSGAGIFQVSGTTNIVGSTLSGNDASGSAGGEGGAGIFVAAGTLDLANVTISNNDTNEDGGGILVGITATVNMNNVTIAGDNDATDDGGGIFVVGGGTVNVSNTIIADNGGGDDCNGTLQSLDFNLIGNTGGCTIIGSTANNITGVDPDLGPLQNNGGPTNTHALLESSAALERGNPNTPDGIAPNCETTDQRGVARPQIIVCDIGAYEGAANFADLSITKSVDNPSALIGDTVTFTVTVTNNGPLLTAELIRVDDLITGPIDVTTITPNSFDCTNNTGSALGTSISNTCTLLSLDSGDSESFTITGEVTELGQIDNIATVFSAATLDLIPSNNIAVASAVGRDPVQPLPPEADLNILKTVDLAIAEVGDEITFTIIVDNEGPSSATDVVVTDTLTGPANFSLTSVSPGCNPGVGSNPLQITCDLGTINPGDAPVEIVIIGNATDLGEILNSASVADLGGTVDPNLSDNASAASVIIVPDGVLNPIISSSGCSLSKAAQPLSLVGIGMLAVSLAFIGVLRRKHS